MADKAESKTRKAPVRRTEAERLEDLKAQIAKIENKDAERKAKRVQGLVAEIAIIDQRIAKLEARRADKDAELQSLAVGSVDTAQLTFTSTEVEEV